MRWSEVVTVDEVQAARTFLFGQMGFKRNVLMCGYEGEELDDIEANIQHVKMDLSGTFITHMYQSKAPSIPHR